MTLKRNKSLDYKSRFIYLTINIKIIMFDKAMSITGKALYLQFYKTNQLFHPFDDLPECVFQDCSPNTIGNNICDILGDGDSILLSKLVGNIPQ